MDTMLLRHSATHEQTLIPGIINIHMQTITLNDNLQKVNIQTKTHYRAHICVSLLPLHRHTRSHTLTHTHHLCSAPNQLLSIHVFRGAQPISFRRDTALMCKCVIECACVVRV